MTAKMIFRKFKYFSNTLKFFIIIISRNIRKSRIEPGKAHDLTGCLSSHQKFYLTNRDFY